jgi:hypothetical protein
MTSKSMVTMGDEHLQPVSNTGGAGDLISVLLRGQRARARIFPQHCRIEDSPKDQASG